MSKTSTEQLCDSIIALFDEIEESDKETAGIALITLLAIKSGKARKIIDRAKGEIELQDDRITFQYSHEYEELAN
jgi:hypothetical protein